MNKSELIAGPTPSIAHERFNKWLSTHKGGITTVAMTNGADEDGPWFVILVIWWEEPAKPAQ